MFYQLIARLDKKLNFATVSAHSDGGKKNDLPTEHLGQRQPRGCSSWLEDSLNLSESA
ncbi:hypothetical protein [Thalassomonas haliotis]|uniref:Uncharacterized protein n=1 Tax=Thalassomonas haliotis TaxID=485448 RepID=A0ABY7VBL1_9GAMM|nr:hypothetical protein [Thalassomonas haliotis]WDE10298.1 hypothetical protein H3N35_18725 [Thalassomonas haliotis]